MGQLALSMTQRRKFVKREIINNQVVTIGSNLDGDRLSDILRICKEVYPFPEPEKINLAMRETLTNIKNIQVRKL